MGGGAAWGIFGFLGVLYSLFMTFLVGSAPSG